jgi:hypothetical protein
MNELFSFQVTVFELEEEARAFKAWLEQSSYKDEFQCDVEFDTADGDKLEITAYNPWFSVNALLEVYKCSSQTLSKGGETTTPLVTIELPPVVESFEVPSREEVLALRAGDSVKIVFQQKDLPGERMWVKLTTLSTAKMVGTLESTPLFISLETGAEVSFHPLAIVAIVKATAAPTKLQLVN